MRFKEVLLPGLAALVERYGEIYYLLVLDIKIENFTAGAWIQDMKAVTSGEAKGFSLADLDKAKAWLSIKA